MSHASQPNRPTAGERVAAALEELAREFRITSSCLFGSAARGDATAVSDVDVLVISPDRALRPTTVLRRARERGIARMRPVVFTDAQVRQLCERGTLFAWHLRLQGQILYDEDAALARRLAHAAPLATDYEACRIREGAGLYDHLDRFGGEFLSCLSHLYVLGKRAAMIGVAATGSFEFNRERVFVRARELYPDAAPQFATVKELRPFFHEVSGRERESLPFEPYGAIEETAAAREAVKQLASLGLR